MVCWDRGVGNTTFLQSLWVSSLDQLQVCHAIVRTQTNRRWLTTFSLGTLNVRSYLSVVERRIGVLGKRTVDAMILAPKEKHRPGCMRVTNSF